MREQRMLWRYRLALWLLRDMPVNYWMGRYPNTAGNVVWCGGEMDNRGVLQGKAFPPGYKSDEGETR